MNCCDDYGQCKEGHGCPARSTKCESKFWLDTVEDKPFVSFEDAIQWARNILAIVGAIALSAVIGLHFAGFFTWLFHLKG